MGLSAAFSLGVREDFGLFVAGIVGTFLIVLRNMAHGRSAIGEWLRAASHKKS
jgi:hypothetical protein